MTAQNLRLASRIKQARERLGLSQTEAAAAWGIPLATLKKWEQATRTPGGEALQRLLPILEPKQRNITLPKIHRNMQMGNLWVDVSKEVPKTFQNVELNNGESIMLGFAESGNLAAIILFFLNGLETKSKKKGGAKLPPP